MNAALWLLIGLQVRGWLRYLLRSLRTLKGALLALVGLAVFVPWLLASCPAPRPGRRLVRPQPPRRWPGPACCSTAS